MSSAFDAIVVGTGQAGPSLAARLVREGLKTAVVERGAFGGTCVNNGCIPTKTLVASARVAYLARRAAEFGVDVGDDVRVDMQRVKARKDAIVAQSRDGLGSWLEGMEGLTVFHGHGRLERPGTVRVGDSVLTSERIFLNVGGRARVPPMPGIDDVPFLTNANVMDVDFLPEHLVVVGGSYIGLEFAQMYRRFGSRVTVVEMGERVTSREDEDVSAAVQEILEAEGIVIHTKAECIALSKHADGVAVGVDCDEEDAEPIVGSHLLLAVGRVPNTDDLGLEAAGVETDGRGYITVDDQCRTNVPGIWALGDANGRGAFTHTAYNDFEIVAANLFDDDPRKISDRIPAYALYIDPPLGRVGLTEHEVRASGRKALIGTMPMTRVGRAKERGETQGFMKVLVDAETKRILGASILGIGGDEIVHSLLDVMYADAPYTVVQRAVHIHPTVTELVPTLLGQLEPLA